MSNERIIDTGVIEGSMLEHFVNAAAGINARMAGLILMEPGPMKWGTSRAEFQRNVAEQLAQSVEGFDAERLDGNGKLVPARFEGYPDISAAAENGTLRLLIGIDSDGCRKVACAIVGGTRATAVPRQASAPSASWKGSLAGGAFMAAGFLAAWWIWTRPAGALSNNARYGLLFLVILVFSALATWASGSGSRR
jgi:hypothetical protein